MKLPIKLEALGLKIEACGSRVTCDPAPTNTDADYLVEIPQFKNGLDEILNFQRRDLPDVVAFVVSALSDEGYAWEGPQHYQTMIGSDFMSFRKGSVNLIVTASASFARRHRAATQICKRLNLLAKDDRISVFQAVLYGNVWDREGALSHV